MDVAAWTKPGGRRPLGERQHEARRRASRSKPTRVGRGRSDERRRRSEGVFATKPADRTGATIRRRCVVSGGGVFRHESRTDARAGNRGRIADLKTERHDCRLPLLDASGAERTRQRSVSVSGEAPDGLASGGKPLTFCGHSTLKFSQRCIQWIKRPKYQRVNKLSAVRQKRSRPQLTRLDALR